MIDLEEKLREAIRKDAEYRKSIQFNSYRVNSTKKDLEDRLGALAEECWDLDKQRTAIVSEIKRIEHYLSLLGPQND